jgi:hypothetical protein
MSLIFPGAESGNLLKNIHPPLSPFKGGPGKTQQPEPERLSIEEHRYHESTRKNIHPPLSPFKGGPKRRNNRSLKDCPLKNIDTMKRPERTYTPLYPPSKGDLKERNNCNLRDRPLKNIDTMNRLKVSPPLSAYKHVGKGPPLKGDKGGCIPKKTATRNQATYDKKNNLMATQHPKYNHPLRMPHTHQPRSSWFNQSQQHFKTDCRVCIIVKNQGEKGSTHGQ